MGKRGPKLGHGGRPRTYDDEYHRIKREQANAYNQRLRLEASSENSSFQVMRLFNIEKTK